MNICIACQAIQLGERGRPLPLSKQHGCPPRPDAPALQVIQLGWAAARPRVPCGFQWMKLCWAAAPQTPPAFHGYSWGGLPHPPDPTAFQWINWGVLPPPRTPSAFQGVQLWWAVTTSAPRRLFPMDAAGVGCRPSQTTVAFQEIQLEAAASPGAPAFKLIQLG